MSNNDAKSNKYDKEDVMSENGAAVDTKEQIELAGSNAIVFPFMMYHPAFPPEVANNPEEVKVMKSKGWRTTPVPPSEEELVKSKIKYHESELEILYKNLEAIQESRKHKALEKEKEKVEEAKETIRKASEDASKFVCSKCGKRFENEKGKMYHEERCKGKKKQ